MSLGEPSPDDPLSDSGSPLNEHAAYMRLKRAHFFARRVAAAVVLTAFAASLALLPGWLAAVLWTPALFSCEYARETPERLLEVLGWPLYAFIMRQRGESPSKEIYHGRVVSSTTWV
jgi:hypothetical protein